MATRQTPFRFTDEELARWDLAAENEGLNRTAWIRQACDRHAADPVLDVVYEARPALTEREPEGRGSVPAVSAVQQPPSRSVSATGDLAPSPEARQALTRVQSGRTPYKPPYK